MRTGIAGLLLILLTGPIGAGEYNSKLSPGDQAPSWESLPGVDGAKHSLADLKDKEAVVVFFTCCSCPAAVDYEDRILAFATKHIQPKGKVGLVAINVNTIDEDKLPMMKERAKEKNFTFPYLYDESQKIAKDFGAAYTPEFFVLDQKRRVVYMGALDDQDDPDKVKRNFLEEGVKAALQGAKPTTGETLARGCRIRFNKPKRK